MDHRPNGQDTAMCAIPLSRAQGMMQAAEPTDSG